MSATLYQLTNQMADIEAMLEKTGGELSPELETLWEETSESLPQKVDGYNQMLRNLTAYASNLADEIKNWRVYDLIGKSLDIYTLDGTEYSIYNLQASEQELKGEIFVETNVFTPFTLKRVTTPEWSAITNWGITSKLK